MAYKVLSQPIGQPKKHVATVFSLEDAKFAAHRDYVWRYAMNMYSLQQSLDQPQKSLEDLIASCNPSEMLWVEKTESLWESNVFAGALSEQNIISFWIEFVPHDITRRVAI